MAVNPITTHSLPLRPLSRQDRTQKPAPLYIEQLISRAETLARLSDSGNLSTNRSLNLILMAKKAMQNGNLYAAQSWVQKAIALIRPLENSPLMNPDKVPQAPKGKTPESPSEKDLQRKETTKHFYRDVSSGEAVSFKYGSHLTGPQSFISVPAHEREHVRHAISRAILRGERVETIVSYKVRYDPKTGEPYVAGGVTRVITHPKHKNT